MSYLMLRHCSYFEEIFNNGKTFWLAFKSLSRREEQPGLPELLAALCERSNYVWQTATWACQDLQAVFSDPLAIKVTPIALLSTLLVVGASSSLS